MTSILVRLSAWLIGFYMNDMATREVKIGNVKIGRRPTTLRMILNLIVTQPLGTARLTFMP